MTNGRLKLNTILTLICVVFIMIGAIFGEKFMDLYQVRLLNMWGVYIIMVASFNLVYGFTGQFSLAHAGLAAIGAYTVALLTLSPENKMMTFLIAAPIWPIRVAEWPFLPALLFGGLLAAFVGFLIAAPALRLRGDYLLIVTFGFSEIIRLALTNMPSVCNGAMGLKGIPDYSNLTWVMGTVIITIFVIKRLIDSSYGRALKCVREDEIAAEAVGVNLFRTKMLAFIISSFFVGIAGGLFANILGTIDPNTFKPYLTYAVVTMAVLGGVQSLTGGVIAAGIYTLMSELLRSVEEPRMIFNYAFEGLPGLRMLAFAIMLLFLILFARGGIMGSKEFSWKGIFSFFNRVFKRKME